MSDGRKREEAVADRCAWSESSEEMIGYHDTEWGVPVHDDRRHFEYLLLDAFQAGLSWAIILRKRTAFREAFDAFDPVRVAAYGERKVEELLANGAIIRNRQKIRAAVRNARAFLRVREEFGSFDAYVWRFVGGTPIQNGWRRMSELPARTAESESMSRDLAERGFSFVGPTICYAYMQAAGLVNDHVESCFRYPEVKALGRRP
ncbi:MAG: DNA-3-methyladenine glycosylase I [Gemmatimonadota bacterium]